MSHETFMRYAVEEAKKGDFPFGAVIVRNQKIISKGNNKSDTDIDPTCHCEINAIRKACKKLNSKYLENCTLYTTCEPCPMCFTALVWAKIPRLVYGIDMEDLPIKEWKIWPKCKNLNVISQRKVVIIKGVCKELCLSLFDGFKRK